MNKFLLIFFCVFLFSLVCVSAEWLSYNVCEVDTVCEISVFTVNRNVHGELRDATCNITVYNTSDALIINQVNLTRTSLGHYHYDITPNVTGQFHGYIWCTNSSGSDGVFIMSSGSQAETNPILDGDVVQIDFLVTDGEDYWMLAILLPILCVIGVFAYFSIRMDKIHYFIKVLLFLASISLSIVAVNIGRLLVEEYSSTSTDLISLLNVASFVLIIFLIVVTAYLIIYYIAELLWGIAKTNFGKTP